MYLLSLSMLFAQSNIEVRNETIYSEAFAQEHSFKIALPRDWEQYFTFPLPTKRKNQGDRRCSRRLRIHLSAYDGVSRRERLSAQTKRDRHRGADTYEPLVRRKHGFRGRYAGIFLLNRAQNILSAFLRKSAGAIKR